MTKNKSNDIFKFKNSILFTFICVMLLIIIVAFDNCDAYADASYGDYLYKVNSDNTCTITGRINFNSDVVIPSTINGHRVSGIGDYAFFVLNESPTSVYIPEGVTSIGIGAFKGCDLLTSITIPNSVNSIGGSAFSGCKRLTTISIPYMVTSIEPSTFYGCSKLSSISIPNDIRSIKKSAFEKCSSLVSVSIPDSVISIEEHAFYDCSSLKSITIPYGVTSIDYEVFYNCSSLKSVSIPQSVTSVDWGAFINCKSLTSIFIPKNVESIKHDAFANCSSLDKISVDSDNFYYDSRNNCNAIIDSLKSKIVLGCKNTIIPKNILSIGLHSFDGCSGLTSIIIPEGVTSIETCAFRNCNNLTSITIPESITSIEENAFSIYNPVNYSHRNNNNITFKVVRHSTADWWLKQEGFKNLEYTLGDSIGSIVKSGNAKYEVTKQKEVVFVKPNNKKMKKITIPATITIDNVVYNVTSIKADAFKNNKKLKNVTIGKNITTIGNSSFFGCKKLKKVTFKTTILKKIEKKAFKGTHKTIQFKCPKKNLKKYKKLLKKSGVSKKAKYIS